MMGVIAGGEKRRATDDRAISGPCTALTFLRNKRSRTCPTPRPSPQALVVVSMWHVSCRKNFSLNCLVKTADDAELRGIRILSNEVAIINLISLIVGRSGRELTSPLSESQETEAIISTSKSPFPEIVRMSSLIVAGRSPRNMRKQTQ